MEIELQYDRVKKGGKRTWVTLGADEQHIHCSITRGSRGWLSHTARRTGVSKNGIIREALEEARNSSRRPFLRLAGTVAGPAGLSSRKGFSRE